jgi:hypothetical protein
MARHTDDDGHGVLVMAMVVLDNDACGSFYKFIIGWLFCDE